MRHPVGRNLVVGLTTVFRSIGTTQINHLVFWSMSHLWLIKPFLKPFLRFLQQDRDIVEKAEGLVQPNLMLINDADVQAKWYFRLKKLMAMLQIKNHLVISRTNDLIGD